MFVWVNSFDLFTSGLLYVRVSFCMMFGVCGCFKYYIVVNSDDKCVVIIFFLLCNILLVLWITLKPISYKVNFFLNLFIQSWAGFNEFKEKLIIRTFWTSFSEMFLNISTIYEVISQSVRYYWSGILYEMG